jgi:uncharacterized protein HemY
MSDHRTKSLLAQLDAARDSCEALKAQNERLRETAKLALNAFVHHDDWCGYNRSAEGHPSLNKAWAALDAALAKTAETEKQP